MATALCPHCGERNFTIEGWADLDHCSRCGRRLARKDLRPVNELLAEYLREVRPGTGAERPATHGPRPRLRADAGEEVTTGRSRPA
jgi:hypothetical protein